MLVSLKRIALAGALTSLVACGSSLPHQASTAQLQNGEHRVIIEDSSLVLIGDGGSVPLVIYFENDSDRIQRGSYRPLNALATFLHHQSGTLPVEVQGHADERGSSAYNEALSVRRAQAVKRYLVEHGVDAGSLHATGYGEARPIAAGDNQGRNRRVEFAIRSAEQGAPEASAAVARSEPGSRP